MNTLTITFEDDAERDRKLASIMQTLGFTVTRTPPERVTVGELAKLVGRSVATVSRSLRRGSCPDFNGRQGVKKLLWLEPNPQLIDYLTPRQAQGRAAKI